MFKPLRRFALGKGTTILAEKDEKAFTERRGTFGQQRVPRFTPIIKRRQPEADEVLAASDRKNLVGEPQVQTPPTSQNENSSTALGAPDDFTPAAKRQRLEPETAEKNAMGGLSCEQRTRIDQNRLAALERKQQKIQELGSDDVSVSQQIAELRARIEQTRLEAEALNQQKASAQEASAEQQARIEQNRLAALERKQQKAGVCQEQGVVTAKTAKAQKKAAKKTTEASVRQEEAGSDSDDDAESSSGPPTPSLNGLLSDMEFAPSTPGEGEEDDGSNGNRDSLASGSSRSGTSSSRSSSGSSASRSSDSSSSDSSSSDSSSSSDDSESEAENDSTPAQSSEQPTLTKPDSTPPESSEQPTLAKPLISAELVATPEAPSIEAETTEKALPATDVATAAPEEERALPQEALERDAKQKLVAQVLCRWWFAMSWPPADFDSDAALKGRGFRRVPLNTFDQEPELDELGRRKAYELEQFKGCFRAFDGELLDVRPVEGRPSWDQMMLKSKPELYRLLLAAYDAQLAELVAESQKSGASTELQSHVEPLRKQASKVRQQAMFYLSFKPKEGPAKN